MWLPAIQQSYETLKTASPHGRSSTLHWKKSLWIFSKEKKSEHKEQKQLLKAATSSNVSAPRASFLVANCIAKAKKPFTVGDKLILPSAKDICHELLGEAAVWKVACVPPLASTITRWIDELARGYQGTIVREDWWVTVVCNPGWQIYRCWQWGNNACFCAMYFSGGCAWGRYVHFCCHPTPRLQN